MRLTRTTSHAIRILVDCAEAEGRLVKTADIAERLDISPLNVFKIVHILSRAGFLEPVRGRNGGVRLARPAGEIRIGQVVRSIEEPEVEVIGAANGQGDARPQLNSLFDSALDAFIGVLDGHTLADMAHLRMKSQQRTRSASKTRKIAGAAKGKIPGATRGD